MIRKLLATTALAGFVATGAFAQTATTPATQPSADAAQTTTSNQAAMPAGQMQGQYLQKLGQDQYLASNLKGKDVYESQSEDATSIGEIDNFLIGKDGQAVAAIVDFDGKYLGGDSRTIAVPFEQVSWAMDKDGKPRAILAAQKDQLAKAPTFKDSDTAQANNTAQPATGATATGTTAMAPAAGSTAATSTAANTTTTPAASTSTTGTNMAAGSTAATANASTDMAANGQYPAMPGPDQYLSENVIGTSVYNGTSQDADSIGDINDLVLASSGKVDAAVIGVGGFLGIGEKDVAVPFQQVAFNKDDKGKLRASMSATKDQLKQAPKFDTSSDDNKMAANQPATGTAAMAPAATTGTSDQSTMAAGTAAPAATGTAATTDTTATASTGGTDVRKGMTKIENSQLSADNLMGTTVYGPNDDNIGDIGDIALTSDGKVDAVIVDVGGFLGIGEKPVAVAMDNLQFMKDANGKLYLYTNFTQDQLKNAPEYNKDTYAENRDKMRIQSGSGDMAPATKKQ